MIDIETWFVAYPWCWVVVYCVVAICWTALKVADKVCRTIDLGSRERLEHLRVEAMRK